MNNALWSCIEPGEGNFGSLMNYVLGAYIDSGEGNFGNLMNNVLWSYIDPGECNFGSLMKISFNMIFVMGCYIDQCWKQWCYCHDHFQYYSHHMEPIKKSTFWEWFIRTLEDCWLQLEISAKISPLSSTLSAILVLVVLIIIIL